MRNGAAQILPCLMAVLLAGCAGAPQAPPVGLQRGDRVGVLVELPDRPVHTHYGPAGVGRYAVRYPYSWQLDAAVTDILRRELGLAGFVPVDLEAQGLRQADLAGPTNTTVPEAAEALRRQGLRAVVMVRDARTLAALDCAEGGCEEHYADGPGLYTRGTAGTTAYYAAAAFAWRVRLLDPPVELDLSEPLRTTLKTPSVQLLAFPPPARLDALTEAELAPARGTVLEYAEATAEDVVRSLGGTTVIETRR